MIKYKYFNKSEDEWEKEYAILLRYGARTLLNRSKLDFTDKPWRIDTKDLVFITSWVLFPNLTIISCDEQEQHDLIEGCFE